MKKFLLVLFIFLSGCNEHTVSISEINYGIDICNANSGLAYIVAGEEQDDSGRGTTPKNVWNYSTIRCVNGASFRYRYNLSLETKNVSIEKVNF